MAGGMAVHYSSKTDKHNTPGKIITAAIYVMGGIDLDPCSNSRLNPNVPAARLFTEADNGLIHPWNGRVYMNPPYGRAIKWWAQKFREEAEAENMTEGIALVPARTDTKWIREFNGFLACHIRGRLTFGQAEAGAPFPSVVFYHGPNPDRFSSVFGKHGDIWQRIGP